MKKKKKFLLLLLFVISGLLYYFIYSFGNNSEKDFIQEEIKIKRALDGDTLELEDGRKVRMLGINTPEKGKFMSKEALEMTKTIENKKVILLYNQKDKYGRVLGYIFFEGENFNKKILENGLAHLYYYEKDRFFEEMKETEKRARENKKGIWKESRNKECVSLIKFDYKEKKRCNNEEILVLENSCNKSIKVLIKDDSTKQTEEEIKQGIFSKNFSCAFNDEGDSLYVWDNEGLILFYRYP
ncbi:MAG: thermonuclease family protein [Candidatus Pacearchaeota archaeon]